jgi:predicted transposase/invertase (TIGR01784 family)
MRGLSSGQNKEEKFMARRPKRIYKDTLFRTIYSGKDERSKRWILSLYNALTGKNYMDTSDLEITTLEDVIYITMKNDLSFLIDSQMNLFEHQSSVNPNMPLRGLMYFSKLYQKEIEKHDADIYGKTLVTIPSPRFVVFYNGNEEQEDIVKYSLSDSFKIPDDSGEFEWTATVININKGHNEPLQKKCKSLYHYCVFVNRVKENLEKKMPLSEAVDEAVDFAINSKFLDGFFKEQRGAIMGDLLTEFDQEAYDRHRRAEGRAEGLAEGTRNKALEAARNLLAMNLLTIEQIAQASGLPVTEVQEIAKEVCKPQAVN